MSESPPTPLRHLWAAGGLATLPFLIVMVPFGLVFGIIAAKAGLSLAQILGFSGLVLAGASQITAVQLIADGAPWIIVLVSALAVNLRMVMYSAALTPWLGHAGPRARALVAFLLVDQTFALSLARFEADPRMSMPQRLAYFAGTATVLVIAWPLSTLVGATMGQAIPPRFALDFAVPITFLALVAPMLRTRAHAVAAAVSFGTALLLSGLPSGLGLLVAAPVAMAVGAAMERRQPDA